MNRIDRLIVKAKPKTTICEKLAKDNAFLGKTDAELLDYMGPVYRAPQKGTWEFSQFMYALCHAPHEPSELEMEDCEND